MGLYHCLLGVPYYDCEGCIDCGMCSAVSKEEMIEASRKVREYLKSHAIKSGPVKKIALCGKGGAGKSTVSALLAAAYRQADYSVIVFDTDESNPGLCGLLGLSSQPEPLADLFNKFYAAPSDPVYAWLRKDVIIIEDIPRPYIINENKNRFLMAGKIEEPFQGCACAMSGVTCDLVQKLTLKDREVLIIDMEAGVESFGRGVERSADTVLAVVEPSFQSVELAKKINYMAQGMGVRRVRAVLNKIASPEVEQKIAGDLAGRGIKVIGAIIYDNTINEAGFEGRLSASEKAKDDIRAIVNSLIYDI